VSRAIVASPAGPWYPDAPTQVRSTRLLKVAEAELETLRRCLSAERNALLSTAPTDLAFAQGTAWQGVGN
jgi:hypothetical protein